MEQSEIEDRKKAALLGMSYDAFVARREELLKQAKELNGKPENSST
jgi:hypothetical protein